jgi:hypothetical protein
MLFIFDILGRMRGLERRSLMLYLVIQASLNLISPIVGVLFIPNKLFKSDFRWCRTV